jgi:4-amino-4-deoxy-L-arabinose transferase-like glycosyltransferase
VAHGRWLVGRVVTALLGALAVGLLGLLALELFPPVVGVIAAALAAVATPLAVGDLSLESEPLFIPLALAALLAAARLWRGRELRWALVAGLLAGLATLTRANGAVLLAPVALAAWPGRRWLALAALVCAFAVAIVP